MDPEPARLAAGERRGFDLCEGVDPRLRAGVAVHPNADVPVVGVHPDDVAGSIAIPVGEVDVTPVQVDWGRPYVFLRPPERLVVRYRRLS